MFVALLVVLVILASENTHPAKLDWVVGSTQASLSWIILAAAVFRLVAWDHHGGRRPPTDTTDGPVALTMVEPGRKHGPFDSRYPVSVKQAATTWELQPDQGGLERLDWSTFLARFFPNRRRHDFEALAAYESYRNALDQASATAGPVTVQARRAAEAGERVAVASLSAAVLAWEGEGGAVTERVAD